LGALLSDVRFTPDCVENSGCEQSEALIHSGVEAWDEAMMGEQQIDQAALFYEFSLERHVPADHMLRAIDRFVDLEGARAHVAPFYSSTGRPSIDPELLIRMLIVGYCFGIRSDRRLCVESI
jgi:hypothetical protein